MPFFKAFVHIKVGGLYVTNDKTTFWKKKIIHMDLGKLHSILLAF